jgi:hypothetical protein
MRVVIGVPRPGHNARRWVSALLRALGHLVRAAASNRRH